MRDAYGLDDDYREWVRGDRFDPAERWPWWIELVRSGVDRGVAVHRARIVSEPVSAYVRYEYELTAGHNLKAGEDVRWLPRRQASDIALPGNDFWLFDGTTVLFNHFAGDGTMTGEEAVTDPAVVRLCRDAFVAVWGRAVAHGAYRPS
ncbi:hypothetical protein GTW66_04845 [Streptomyces sp. SID5473]|uniref:DUF6879 domain-containing protein n=2 Tax=Streptomyces TaxID=1883 RepID=A0A7G3UMX8_STRT9|nr:MULTISPECIES: DUF6879 family protein [Streptomyces]MYS63460.1 hypothetical protein [Streptomyces sp. SID5473]QKM71783.1 hypothetical protein STSU_022285 [Streptomyces tsukubensis NRRL18488]TAI42986.1 hypothetical protein EWI31_19245 [Streptomyces tsukubensis]